jgi:hypothetical protein
LCGVGQALGASKPSYYINKAMGSNNTSALDKKGHNLDRFNVETRDVGRLEHHSGKGRLAGLMPVR